MKKGPKLKSSGVSQGIAQVDGLLVNEQGDALDLRKVSSRIDKVTQEVNNFKFEILKT